MSVVLPSLSSIEVQNDPFPLYRRLLEEHPVHRDAEGYWVLTRHADVTAALRNHAVFSSAMGVGPATVPGVTIINTDPPAHTRMRGIVQRQFLPGAVEALAQKVEAIAHRLIDESAVRRGTFDLMEDFAIPLPLKVIAGMLGLDPERYRDYRRWSLASVTALGLPESISAQAQYMATSREFASYLTQVSVERARNPKDDLISLLMSAWRKRGKGGGEAEASLSQIEYAHNVELFLTAGSVTTTALIGNVAPVLARQPDAVRETIGDPLRLPVLIEECLRFEGPFQGGFRTTTEAVSLHGVEIPVGSKVVLMFGAANRDPSVFRDPDRFDPVRSPNPHVAFGNGIHHCIGAPLGRMEAKVAAKVLSERFRMLLPDPKQPAERAFTGPLFRSYARMPMKFTLL